jgi:hypothetical protein
MRAAPYDAWIVSQLLYGQDIPDQGGTAKARATARAGQGAREGRGAPVRAVAEHLPDLPMELRVVAWNGFLAGQSGVERELIISEVADQDPTALPPAEDERERPGWTHLGHLSGMVAPAGRYLRHNWLVRRDFNLLTSEPKVGKRHLALDLARRTRIGEVWPDGDEGRSLVATSLSRIRFHNGRQLADQPGRYQCEHAFTGSLVGNQVIDDVTVQRDL